MTPAPPSPPPDDPRSDAELLEAYLRGDARGFETLYARHREFVARVARRFARDESEAMDAFQEAFARVVQHAPRLRLAGKLSTWLYPVIRNLIAERRRKDRNLRLVGDERESDGPGVPAAPSPTGDLDTTELQKRLARLPDDHREVLLLRVVEQMTVEEVSIALGIPEGTVKSRLHHAIKAIST